MTWGRFIRRSASVLLSVVAVYLSVAIGARYWPLSTEQREAIALMGQATPPVAGRDGSDLAWLQDHDVPPRQRHAVADSLRAFYERHADDPNAADRADSPLRAFRALPATTIDGNALCGYLRECLTDVRTHGNEVDALLQQQRDRVVLGRELARSDGVRYGLEPGRNNPLQPTLVNVRLVRMQLARQFTIGQRPEALSGLCSDLAGWRRISGNSDTLIGSMLGLAAVRADAILLSEMIAELPADVALPSACEQALAPTTDAELDSCPMFRFEYRFARKMMSEPPADSGPMSRLAFATIGERNRDATVATRMANYCGSVALATARADRSMVSRADDSTGCSNFRFAVDPAVCIVFELAPADALARYADRRTDTAALLGGLRTADWLRTLGAPPDQWPARIKARPAALGLLREPTLSADRRTLVIPLLGDWHGDEVALAVGRLEVRRQP
jgi:hypothetical protein